MSMVFCGERRSSRMLHLGRAAHVATGSVGCCRTSSGSGHLQTPHSLSVACLSLVLRAAHTNQCDCYSSGRPHSLLFQVIRRPAAPIVLCRPRAPTGLELGPFHQSDDTPRRSSLSAYPAIRSTRRFSRQQRFVVVACLLTLALLAFVAAGAGVGGWASNFLSGRICTPSASFLEGRVAACIFLGSGVSTRPYHTVHPTPFPLFLWLAFPWSSERRTPTSATATVQVGHFLCSPRSTDDLLLRLFSVDLVLRLGLNSIHFTSLMTHLGAVRFPPIRRSGAHDGSLVSSALVSLLAF